MRSLLLLLVLSEVVISSTDYCQLSARHTMCGYQGPGPSCGPAPLARGVSEREREVILQVHNQLRARVATGGERRGQPGPQPPAADMKLMTWDPELARIAQAHADQCKFAHDCADCRRVERWGVGQNLFISKQTVRLPETDWSRAITDWYEEVKLFSKKKVKPFKFSAEYGHYTAMVWATTDKVGCGATSYREGRWLATLYTCNYGPNGNFINGQMYSRGPACSQCQSGQVCSSQYPGLCTSQATFVPSQLRNISTTTTTTTKPTTTAVAVTARSTVARRRPATTSTTTITTSKIFTTSTTDLPSAVVPFRPRDEPDPVLLSCGFETEMESCELRGSGVAWERQRESNGNQFYSTQLLYRDKTDLIFKDLLPPPTNGNVVCVTFKYKKYSLAGHKSSLAVMVWPYKEKPGKISVFRDSPGVSRWMSAAITFRNVDQYFLLLFRTGGPATKRDFLYLAVDDVIVEEGECRA